MLATRSKTIGASLFTVTPLPAMRTFVLQPRLAQPLAEAASAFGLVMGGGDRDVAEMAPIVGRFFAKLPPHELETIVRELLAGSQIDGKPLLDGNGQGGTFDAFMQGRTMDVWLLLWFALEVNYPDFFGRLGGLIARAEKAPASAA